MKILPSQKQAPVLGQETDRDRCSPLYTSSFYLDRNGKNPVGGGVGELETSYL